MKIVLYPQKLLLELTYFHYKPELVISGRVINGRWNYKQIGSIIYVMQCDNKPVNQYDFTGIRQKLVIVPESMKWLGYNEILADLEDVEGSDFKTIRHEFMCYKESQKYLKTEETYDDDIPF